MKLFQRKYYYIKIHFNKVEITDLVTEETVTKTSFEKFSNKRIVIADFNVVELLIKEIIISFQKKTKAFITQNIMLIQQMESQEGGLTEIEKRAMRDLCEQAGGLKVFLILNNKKINVKEALKGIKNNTFSC